MNAVEIEEAISDLVIQPFDREEFPFQFLESFGNKETTLKRLRKGSSNRSDVSGALLQRNNIHILTTDKGGVEGGLKALRDSPKTVQQKAKFILATDGEDLQAENLADGQTIACALTDLPTHFGFLLPLAGISTVKEIKNNPIDIKATGRLDKLYVELLKMNEGWAKQDTREDFNHFMAQLIFCFFAEDTGIFNGDDLFTNTVQQMSDSDGSNTDEIITNVFAAMNLDPRTGDRKGVRPYADVFPYVNGGLFGGDVKVPKFSKIARTYLLRAGELDWTAINPDIFGSMIQAVADDEERGSLGMHYTSVPNILKVLNPLFLDSLNEDLDKAGSNKQQLGKLKKRLAHIRVFDPACGSGNFLVIAYKKMREIEHKANLAGGWEPSKSVIPVRNFRGIEIKSFATEIARLALIIAEYQSDEKFMGQREALALFLPLEKSNWIVCGNALRLDWLSICPPTGETSVKLHGDDLFNTPLDQSEIDFDNEGGETYICGNPPYKGGTEQTKEQKQDLERLLSNRTATWKSLDYVSGWLIKSSDYFSNVNGCAALVMTNSIAQGEQVARLWPLVIGTNIEIQFAYTSFAWRNLAAHNAGVTVIIVGIGTQSSNEKTLFNSTDDGGLNKIIVHNINAYLVPSDDIFITGSTKPLCNVSSMTNGNKGVDGGNLILTNHERLEIIRTNENAQNFILPFFGSAEAISERRRYCIWITDKQLDEALGIPEIFKRIDAVRRFRAQSAKKLTRDTARIPYKFQQVRQTGCERLILIPRVSSESRKYLPVSFRDVGSIISDSAFAMFDAPLWNMALLVSKLHLIWIATVCGKLKTDYRYSNTLGWNTFPVPKLTEKNKADLTRAAENILLAREAHFPATIADLYKPASDKHKGMPKNLRAAHDENDRILEEIYIGRRFKNDTERLEKLFEMYTDMTSKVS